MKNRFCLILFLIGTTLILNGQVYNSVFTVKDENQEPLSNVAIFITSTSDFSGGGYTDTLGQYTFKHSEIGSYNIRASFIGYQTLEQAIELKAENSNYEIKLLQDSEMLDEVEVTALRKLIVREDDRLLLQINGSNTLGSNATEILTKAPGIILNNDQLSFLGKGVEVQINGKKSRLTGTQLINYLNSKNAASIKSIELIANPDASYAADFDGRVINIITKKIDGNGYTASIDATFNQRSKYLSEDIGLDFNLRQNKLSLYANGGYYYSKRRELGKSTVIISNDFGGTLLDENNQNDHSAKGPYYELGMDYFFTENTVFGFKYEGYTDETDGRIIGESKIFNAATLDSIVFIDDRKLENGTLNNLNLNFKTNLDTLGTNLNIDVDFGRISGDFNNDQLLTTFLNDGSKFGETTTLQDIESTSDLFGVKIDLVNKLGKARMTSGVMYTLSRIDQNLSESSRFTPNEVLTDVLHYDEDIYAAYLNVRGKLKKYNYTIGLRGELTSYKGDANTTISKISDQYFNFFPQFILSRSFKEKHYMSLAYKRTIRRPRFQQLIPFKRYVSAFYYFTGNPELQAYFPNSFELNYSFNNSFYSNISYRFAKDRILEYSRLVEDSNVSEGVKENNGRFESVNFSVGYNKRLRPWFYLSSNVSYSVGLQTIELESGRESFDYDAYTIYISPSFTVNKQFKATLSWYYSSDVYYSVSQNLSYWYFDVNLKHSLFDGAGEIAFTARDLFLKGISRSRADYGDILFEKENNWDSRQFILGFSYFFGNDKVKNKRNRRNTANKSTINRS